MKTKKYNVAIAPGYSKKCCISLTDGQHACTVIAIDLDSAQRKVLERAEKENWSVGSAVIAELNEKGVVRKWTLGSGEVDRVVDIPNFKTKKLQQYIRESADEIVADYVKRNNLKDNEIVVINVDYYKQRDLYTQYYEDERALNCSWSGFSATHPALVGIAYDVSGKEIEIR